jgi:hypothetical protein
MAFAKRNDFNDRRETAESARKAMLERFKARRLRTTRTWWPSRPSASPSPRRARSAGRRGGARKAEAERIAAEKLAAELADLSAAKRGSPPCRGRGAPG